MRTISLKLPDHLLARLSEEACKRRMTKSSLVRESLEKTLLNGAAAGTVSCYDLARDLAGMLKRLPEDLADDPKYLRRFGE
jgi:predicted DNA-binding protein